MPTLEEFMKGAPDAPETAADASSVYDWYMGTPDDKKLSMSVEFGLKKAPEQAARLLRLQMKTGLPQDFLERNLDDVELQVEKQGFDLKTFRQKSPALAAWVAQNPDHAALVRDDLDNLSRFEKILGSVSRGYQRGSVQDDLGRLHFQAMTGEISPADAKRRQELKSQLDKLGTDENWSDSGSIGYVGHQVAYTARELLSSFREGGKGAVPGAVVGAGFAAAVGQAGPQVALPEEVLTVPAGAITGARAGFMSGTAVHSFRQEAGFAFDEFSDLEDLDGAKLDPAVARGAAMTVGLLNAALDTAGTVAVAKIVPGLDKIMSKGPRALVRELLQKPTFRSAIADAGKRWATASGTEALTEAVQELFVILGREAAQFVSGQEFKSDDAGADAARVVKSGFDAFIGTAGVTAPFAGLQGYSGVREARQAKQTEEFMKALGESAEASKLRERLPEKFGELAAQIRERGDVESVHIDGQTFARYFQEQGGDPYDVARELLGDDAALRQAIETGGDLTIPLEVYAEKLAATRHHSALVPDVRLRPEDMTPREAAQLEKEIDARAKEFLDAMQRDGVETTDVTDPMDAGAEAVYQDTLGQLLQTTDRATAERQALLNKSVFKTLASRLNAERAQKGLDPLSPEDLYSPYKFRVQRPLPDSLKRILTVDTQVDPLLDMLRTGSIPTDRELYGPSLVEALREKGLRDTGGELAARDVDKRLAPFQKRLAREDGIDLDTAAEYAADWGYIPAGETYTVNGLLDLIDQELRGNPVYSDQYQTDPVLQERASALRDLEAYLTQAGVDLGAMTNEQVREILARESVQGGETLEQLPRALADAMAEAYNDATSYRVTEGLSDVFDEEELLAELDLLDARAVPKDLEPLVEFYDDEAANEVLVADLELGQLAALERVVDVSSWPRYVSLEDFELVFSGERPDVVFTLRVADLGALEKKYKADRVDAWTVSGADFFDQVDDHAGLSAAFRVWLEANGVEYSGGETLTASAYFDIIKPDGDAIRVRFADHGNTSRLHQAPDYNIVSGQNAGEDFRAMLDDLRPFVRNDQVRQAEELEAGTLYQDEPRNLYVAHNLSESNLEFADELGGLAAPSLAVANIDNGAFDSFGEITLLADPGILESPKARTFDADIYSPRQPRPIYDLDRKKFDQLEADVAASLPVRTGLRMFDADEVARGGPTELARSEALQYHWLQSIGQAPKTTKQKVDSLVKGAAKRATKEGLRHGYSIAEASWFKDVAKQHADAIVQKYTEIDGDRGNRMRGMYLDDDGAAKPSVVRELAGRVASFIETDGIDAAALRFAIAKKMRNEKTRKAFEAFATEKMRAMTRGKKLFLGFSNAGNKRYSDYTMDTVVREMTRELQGGEGLNYGAGSVRSAYANEMRSVAQVQKRRGQVIPASEFARVKEESQEKLAEALDALRPFYKFDADSWGYLDDAANAIAEGPKGWREAFNLDAESRKIIEDLIAYLRDLPTEYFETKIQRAVSLGEFSTAIVPRDASAETIAILEKNGIKIKHYKRGDAADRTRAVRSAGKDLLFQDERRPRGQLDIGAGREMTISLFERANLSTFLHESGHFYLEVLGDIAARDDAPDQIKQDFETLVKFGGADPVAWRSMSIDQKRDAHEKIARAFEAYLMEGKAPSVELQSAFARFRAWLVAVYRTVKNLDVQINDDVRRVFDRLLASEDEIAVARDAMRYQEIFSSAEEAGMSPEQFAVYRRDAEAAHAAAVSELSAELQQAWTREARAWWKQEEAKVREEVAAEVNAAQVYIALSAMRRGTMPDGSELPEPMRDIKLDKAALEQLYGPSKKGNTVMDALRNLGLYRVEGGVDPDEAALVFGYSSGDAMVQDMLNAPRREQVILDETAVRMRERYPDPLTDGTITERAIDAVHNDRREDVLAAELAALDRKRKRDQRIVSAADRAERRAEREAREKIPGQATLKVIKEAARQIINRKATKDIKPNQYRAAEQRLARQAFEALAKKDYEAAYQLKRQQIFNGFLYKAARDAREDADSIRDYVTGFASSAAQARLGKAGEEYLDQILAILDRYEFAKIPVKRLEKRKSLAEWIAAQEAAGAEVVIDDALRDEAKRVNWKSIPYEELVGVRDAVKHIAHLARLKNKLLAKGRHEDFEDAVAELVATIYANNDVQPDPINFTPSGMDWAKDKGAQYVAEHTKLEFLFNRLDGHRPMGPVWQMLFKPVADAERAEVEMMRDAKKQIDAIFDRYTPDERRGLSKKVYVRELGASFSRSTLLSLALNWGNAYGREVTVEGYKRLGWTVERVTDALAKHLTAKDLETVNMIWSFVDSYWPEIEQIQREMTGLPPEKVEADPFALQLPDGSVVGMTGGYYPIKYDSRLSWRQKQHDEKQNVGEMFGNNWLRPATRKGHTKERTGSGGKPVKLDLGVLHEHVTNVIHDLTHRRAIIDVDRLVHDQRVAGAIEATVGQPMLSVIRPWLQGIAGDHRQPATIVEAMLQHLRAGASIVSMGWKISTALVQPLGYLQTVDVLGPKYSAIGLKKFYGNPAAMKAKADWVISKSTQMSNRTQSFDRDVRDQLKALSEGGKLSDVRRSFFILTGLTDMLVSVPTWLGAYQKALDGEVENVKAGDDAGAVDYADMIVRMSQSSGSAKDLAHVQSAPLLKLFTVFYSYFNVLFNLFAQRTQMTKSVSDVPRFIASMFALWFLPAVLSELIAGRGPDDDEEWGEWAAKNWHLFTLYPMQTMVGLRDIASGMGAFGYNPSPVFDGLDQTVRALKIPIKAADPEQDVSRSDVKAAWLAASYWGHLPGRQMWITGEFFYDWITGEDEPETWAEALRNAALTRKPD